LAILNQRTGRFLPALDQPVHESDVNQSYIQRYSDPAVDIRAAQGFVHSPLVRSAIINYTDDAAILFARMGSTSFDRISALSTPWKVGGALGLVGAGVLAYSVFSNRFSGKDDAANTIQGFPERGFAKAQREDFGSGWKGLRVSDQPIPLEVQEFREKWYKDDTSAAELRRRVKASSTAYGELDPGEMRRRGKTSRVDTSAYRMAWEDADTILLKSLSGNRTKDDIAIRLAGIDAPEIAHPGDPTEWFRYNQEQPRGQWALEQARAATAGHRVRIEVASDPKQRTYGRYIGLAYLEGHQEPLNVEMARSGIVASLPFGESGSDIYSRKAFISAEQEAINQNRGIWQEEFFQKYLELSKELGGRVTFNSFTDLTRLSKNYHLAAAESFLSGSPGTDPRAGRRLGQRLIPSYGKFFSGRGRAGNTNEGFRHKGIAGATRSRNTDFGSGYQGEKEKPSWMWYGGLAWGAKGLPNVLPNLKVARMFQQGYGTFYHGTPTANVESILQKGLTPNKASLGIDSFLMPPAVRAMLEEKATHVSTSMRLNIARIHAGQGAGKGPFVRNMMSTMGQLLGYSAPDVKNVVGHGQIFEFALSAEDIVAQRSLAAQFSAQIPIGGKAGSLFGEIMRFNKIATDFKVSPDIDLAVRTENIMPSSFVAMHEVKNGKIGARVLLKSEEKIIATPKLGRAAMHLGAALFPVALTALALYKVGQRFSGKDDVYNSIEGLRHGGMAGDLRKEGADFGSGWKGLFGGISRKISKFFASGMKEGTKLLSPMRALEMSSGLTAEEFGKKLGNVVFLKTPEQIKRLNAMIPGVEKAGGAFTTKSQSGEHFVFINPQKIRESFIKSSMKRGLSREVATRGVQGEDFLKTVLYHEHLERQVASSFSKLRTMPTKHAGSQVMIGEGGFAAGTGNSDLLEVLRSARKRSSAETKAFSLGEHLFSPPKIGDPINPVEGMRHGGLAEKLRKIFTMFGSKYDTLKGFIKMAGFQDALKAGVMKGTLGAGRFGEVQLMKGSFRGQEFEFVRKRLLPGAEQEIKQLVNAGARPELLRGLDLENEAKMLEILGDTPLTPSLYGKTKGEIYMERMPGLRLNEQNSLRVGKISEKAGKELQETLDIMSERGIQNLDVHAGNLSYTSEGGGRLSMYDLGMAEQSSSTSYIEKMKRKHRQLGQIGRKDEGIKEYLPQRTKEEIRQQKVLLANQLRSDQQNIWRQATVGGRNHVARTQQRANDQVNFVPTNRLRRK